MLLIIVIITRAVLWGSFRTKQIAFRKLPPFLNFKILVKIDEGL